MVKIRGIECTLTNGRVKDIFTYLYNKPFEYYMPWCMKIDGDHTPFPKAMHNLQLSSQELREIADASIWELVLHLYPVGAASRKIESYDDFLTSACICCIIYYDCGFLDVYIKESNLREELFELLTSIGATDIKLITDASDSRTRLCL